MADPRDETSKPYDPAEGLSRFFYPFVLENIASKFGKFVKKDTLSSGEFRRAVSLLVMYTGENCESAASSIENDMGGKPITGVFIRDLIRSFSKRYSDALSQALPDAIYCAFQHINFLNIICLDEALLPDEILLPFERSIAEGKFAEYSIVAGPALPILIKSRSGLKKGEYIPTDLKNILVEAGMIVAVPHAH